MPRNKNKAKKTSEMIEISENPDPMVEFQRLSETAEINAQFKKSTPLLNLNFSSTDALLEKILKELKAMILEVKEVKEEVRENRENLEKIALKVDEKLEEDAVAHQNIKTMLRTFQEDVKSKNDTFSLEIQQFKGIRERIHGKWMKTDDPTDQFSAKFDNETFMRKWRDNYYVEYKLGVRHSDGWLVSVENDQIVQREHFEDGAEVWRYEHQVDGEWLVRRIFLRGELRIESRFVRVGEPDQN